MIATWVVASTDSTTASEITRSPAVPPSRCPTNAAALAEWALSADSGAMPWKVANINTKMTPRIATATTAPSPGFLSGR